ncbi:DNA-binding protein HU-beta [Nonomuraea fuscirosea]|uniref:DNA-binding protein HU-beta n=1 Tax=Nonomuraea fuscirosea TaxID=1291556 RepID=A0A2T0N2I3_9ACTN|nr:HU family DNA-binding protein [Nonomuraea fuscirosea]PRX66155.1 DNA-binding protein HU-beta [Nonomuraea fuscirosea]
MKISTKKTANLDDIAELVANATDLDLKTAKKAVTATLYAIEEKVAEGKKVVFMSFGRFEAVLRPARTARNPRNGSEVNVPETWKPKFTPGSGFLGLVAEKRAEAN